MHHILHHTTSQAMQVIILCLLVLRAIVHPRFVHTWLLKVLIVFQFRFSGQKVAVTSQAKLISSSNRCLQSSLARPHALPPAGILSSASEHVHVHNEKDLFWGTVRNWQPPGIKPRASDLELSVLYHLSYGHQVTASLHSAMFTHTNWLVLCGHKPKVLFWDSISYPCVSLATS